MKNKMIINETELNSIVDGYIMAGSEAYILELLNSNLKWNKELNIFEYNYTLKIENHMIKQSRIISRNDILVALNYKYGYDGLKVLDYSIIEDETISLELSLERIKTYRKSY